MINLKRHEDIVAINKKKNKDNEENGVGTRIKCDLKYELLHTQ